MTLVEEWINETNGLMESPEIDPHSYIYIFNWFSTKYHGISVWKGESLTNNAGQLNKHTERTTPTTSHNTEINLDGS